MRHREGIRTAGLGRGGGCLPWADWRAGCKSEETGQRAWGTPAPPRPPADRGEPPRQHRKAGSAHHKNFPGASGLMGSSCGSSPSPPSFRESLPPTPRRLLAGHRGARKPRGRGRAPGTAALQYLRCAGTERQVGVAAPEAGRGRRTLTLHPKSALRHLGRPCGWVQPSPPPRSPHPALQACQHQHRRSPPAPTVRGPHYRVGWRGFGASAGPAGDPTAEAPPSAPPRPSGRGLP